MVPEPITPVNNGVRNDECGMMNDEKQGAVVGG
jgi:hypothetical protein